jgi:hypothetical protein
MILMTVLEREQRRQQKLIKRAKQIRRDLRIQRGVPRVVSGEGEGFFWTKLRRPGLARRGRQAVKR